jgi:hypothetical protein
MNTINAGNPSANNMITHQVMQKKRESSSTIFDKLNKRTAQLTAKNPLNNVLTNDQLFRYYIQEVEPKLSQSNDNFQGLPNTTPQTPPDNSIKDTVEKSYGNVKDEYNTGFSGNGVEGILNSNDINSMTPVRLSDPQIPVVFDPNAFDYSSFDTYIQGLHKDEQKTVLQSLYDNNKQNFNLFVEGQLKEAGEEVNDKNRTHLLNTWINYGLIEDKYINTDETRFTSKIEKYDEIQQFLGTLDTNDYHQESAIMLNIFIDNSVNDGSDDLNTHKFFYNLWNDWAGQTTLERSIEDIWNIWSSSEGTPLQEVITDGLNRIFERRDIESFQYDEFRELIFKFINRHQYSSAMSVKKYKTELAKYTLDKMRPEQVCQKMINYFQEELRQSKEHHTQRLQRYRDDQQNDQQNTGGDEVLVGQYQEDRNGNLIQLKDPSTHPSKPQQLKDPSTYPSAPVSAQSVKNDVVILRSSPSFVSHYVKLKPSRVLNLNPDSY